MGVGYLVRQVYVDAGEFGSRIHRRRRDKNELLDRLVVELFTYNHQVVKKLKHTNSLVKM